MSLSSIRIPAEWIPLLQKAALESGQKSGNQYARHVLATALGIDEYEEKPWGGKRLSPSHPSASAPTPISKTQMIPPSRAVAVPARAKPRNDETEVEDDAPEELRYERLDD